MKHIEIEREARLEHNTACLYQYELDFLNIKDSPELRKIFWSAMGGLRFDDNDQVIVPDLNVDDCPICLKGG